MSKPFFCASVLTCLASMAACGGAGQSASPIECHVGERTPIAQTPQSAPAVQPDPAFDARSAFSNPGGMWLPTQMTLDQHVQNFKLLGVSMDPKKLSNPLEAPLGAVVSLGGCTGSFVSASGLLVTNHHCVQRALQFNATEKQNLVEQGFLAKTLADEKSAGPAQRISVAQAFRDVTTEMTDGLAKIADPIKRHDEIEARHKKIVAACEKDRPEIRCQISKLFRGDQYQLIEYLEIKDVRLVYAPKRSVGNYGGEVDNWAWPRHTGDFSYYRAYVGKDGKPADFSPNNVPFKPAHWLKVSAEGLKPHDFVMVTGYPAITHRTTLASDVRHSIEWGLPYTIARAKDKYAFYESHLKDGGEISIKAGVAKQGVQNGLEKNQGILSGLTKGDLASRRDALDAKIKEWAAQPGHEQHKSAIEKLEQIMADERKTARADFERTATIGGTPKLGTESLLAAASLVVRLADERAKPNADRKSGFQERDMPRIESAQKQFNRSYDRVLDRGIFRLALVRSLELPEADRPWLPVLLGMKKGQKIDEASIDKTLDAWYGAASLEDEATRLSLVKSATPAQLKSSKDPFIQAALRVQPVLRAEEKKDDRQAGELLLIQPKYADAMRQVLGGFLAPDANSTLRVTYGTVKPFKKEGAAHSASESDWPFTVAKQLLAKDKGKEPFNAPKPVLDAIKAKRYGAYADASLGGELPMDFLSDVDITGGNSGSPTLNSKGELVGLAFDGTIEGVSSDVLFNAESTRTIHVDARYMLWVMDALDGADHLIKEMGLTPSL